MRRATGSTLHVATAILAIAFIARSSGIPDFGPALADAPEGSDATPPPSTPTQTSATPMTPEPTLPPPTAAATATPSATEAGEPEARIYLPMILRQARPGLDPAHLVDEDIDPKAWPHAPYQIRSATVAGDVLLLTLSYGGGCERHDFQLVVSTRFLETFPVRARAFVTHEDHDDPCDALVTRKLGFDLEPLEQAFKDAYPSDPGPLLIELEGWEEALRFEMD